MLLADLARKEPERLTCPSHFQRRLTQVGGLNRYRQPNFNLVWAQTALVKQGGEWESEGEWFRGYRDVYLGDGLPHWMLLQWVDAGKSFQLPHIAPESWARFYHDNKCRKTGLQLLGEYPYRGSYQVVLNLLAKQFVPGGEGKPPKLFIEAFPLSTEIVEMMVPLIKASMEVSIQAKMKFMKEEDEKDDAERSQMFEDFYSDAHRKETLASTAWLEDKQRQIERAANSSFIAMLSRNKKVQTTRRLPNYAS